MLATLMHSILYRNIHPENRIVKEIRGTATTGTGFSFTVRPWLSVTATGPRAAGPVRVGPSLCVIALDF